MLESKKLSECNWPAGKKCFRVTDKLGNGRLPADWGGASKLYLNEWAAVDALNVFEAVGRLCWRLQGNGYLKSNFGKKYLNTGPGSLWPDSTMIIPGYTRYGRIVSPPSNQALPAASPGRFCASAAAARQLIRFETKICQSGRSRVATSASLEPVDRVI